MPGRKWGLKWVNRKRRLNAYAKARGIPRPKGFRPLSPSWGAPAREMVRRIEARAWGIENATGQWSDRLARLITPKTTSRNRALALAKSQIGVKEHPANSNDGPKVREYQRVTGAFKAPWCASFVAWAYKEAGRPLSGFNAAFVPSYVDSARRGRNGLVVVASSKVLPGDLCCFDWGRDGIADHIGIVSRPPDSRGNFTAVEGNTSFGNNSNGGEVMLRNRTTSEVLAFVRVMGD